MIRILNFRRFLRYYVITISVLLVSGSIIGISLSEGNDAPRLISESSGENLIIWEFDDASNYLMNNTVIENGIVQLEKIASSWNQSTSLDYSNGRTQNITINDGGELELSIEREELVIDVETDRSEAFRIDNENAGYQIFRFNKSIIISKIKFLAKLDDEVSSNLNISIETENDEILDFKSLSPTNFSSEISEITVNLSCKINADSTYRLKFKSENIGGSYKLIGDSESVYSNGYFQELNVNNGVETAEELDDDENIEFEIFALRYSTNGIFESGVKELASPVIWTDLQWIGKNITDHEDIKVQVRSGNSSTPQESSWTKWMNVNDNNQNMNNLLSIPPATSIQYRIIFSTIEPYQTPTFVSINISYERYFSFGSIETLDFETNETSLWLNFSKNVNYQEQIVDFYFSIDSGSQWSAIGVDNESISLNNHSKKIGFLARFNSKNNAISPTLDSISLSFIRFDPGTGESEKEGEDELPESQPSGEPLIFPPDIILMVGISAGLFSIVSWGVGTETGKYTILRRSLFLVIPLYNKINRDKVLDHYLRNQIYKYIQTNPGTNYSEIMKDTGVKNGVLVHHLKTLDREGLIKSIRDGMFRRFYPIGVKIPQKEIANLSWFQIRIFNFIRTNPGTTPKDIADEVGKSKQVINYHLNLMKNAALVRAKVQGRYTQLYAIYSESESKNMNS